MTPAWLDGLTRPLWVLCGCPLSLGEVLGFATGAPMLDALITALSLCAQWLQPARAGSCVRGLMRWQGLAVPRAAEAA